MIEPMAVYRNRTKYPKKPKPVRVLRNAHEAPLEEPILPITRRGDLKPPAKWSHLPKWERDHLAAVRAAREKAASDPTNPVDRAAIIRRDDKTCWICKRRLQLREIELDHVIPLVRGGRHTPENLRVACRDCNRWHGDRIVQPL